MIRCWGRAVNHRSANDGFWAKASIAGKTPVTLFDISEVRV
jgi:hypothetical protein